MDSGLVWFDTDGVTSLTAAVAGDYADYNGTAWVKQGNLVGPAGTVTTDPVETVFDNSGPGGTALSANLSSRTWGAANTIVMNLDRQLTVLDDSQKFIRIWGRYQTAGQTRRFDDMFSAASFMALGEKETSGNNYTNTFTRTHPRNLGISLTGGFRIMSFNYARRETTQGGQTITQVVVGFGTQTTTNLTQWVVNVDLVSFIGSQGGQGRYSADIYRNAPDQTPPPTPTGGTVDVDTGVVTPPANWSNVVITPGTGQRTFGSRAVINPIMDTGIITPTWGGVYTLGSEGLDGSDGTPGTEWSIGNAFPTAPNTGDIHLFSGNVAGGLSWLDTDGTTILLDAGQGDYARYDGSDWIKQGRLDGSGSLILPDEVIRYPWRTTLSAGYTAASELDVDGLPPFTGTFFLTGFVDDGGALRRYFEFGALSQDDDDLTLGLKPGAKATIRGEIYTVRSSQVVSGRNRIIFEEGTELDFAQGDSYVFIIHFLSDSHLTEFLADRVTNSVIPGQELRAGHEERFQQGFYGDTRLGQHFLVAPRGEGEVVLYRGHARMSIGIQTTVPILSADPNKNRGPYAAVERLSSIDRILIDQDGTYTTAPDPYS